MRLLLVEDETRMAQALKELLSQEHYQTDVCGRGDDGLDAALSGIYDLLILDVMLPGMDGYEIIRRVRQAGLQTPALMLTAKSDLSDKVTGLDSGADDYLTKPFEIPELMARVRALLRRGSGAEQRPDGRLACGDLLLDRQRGEISSRESGRSIRISEKECALLECLMSRKGETAAREQLAVKVWGYDSEAEYNNVEVYISFVRKKMKLIGTPVQIKAVRGFGYRLESTE